MEIKMNTQQSINTAQIGYGEVAFKYFMVYIWIYAIHSTGCLRKNCKCKQFPSSYFTVMEGRATTNTYLRQQKETLDRSVIITYRDPFDFADYLNFIIDGIDYRTLKKCIENVTKGQCVWKY